MKIPDGYKIAIITPDGEVADTIEIDGYHLGNVRSDTTLCAEIEDVVATAERRLT